MISKFKNRSINLIESTEILKPSYMTVNDIKSIQNRGVLSRHYIVNDKYELYNERNVLGEHNMNIYGRLCFKKLTESTYIKTAFPNILDLDSNEGGVEDPRIFVYKNQNYVIFNGLLKSLKNSRQMFLYNLDTNHIVHLTIKGYDVIHSIQKNWTPYVYNSKIFFLYSLEPVCILELTNERTGICKRVYGEPIFHVHPIVLRGGTPLIPWNYPYYLGCGHISDPYRAIFFTYNIITTNVIKYDILNELYKQNRRINFPYDLQVKDDKVVLGCNFEDVEDTFFYFKLSLIETYIGLSYNPMSLNMN